MNSNNGHYLTSHQQLRPESISVFIEGINLILSRWIGLQLAIKMNGVEEILVRNQNSLFLISSLGFHYLKVAEELIKIYEDCLQGSHESVEKLRKSNSGAEFVSQVPTQTDFDR
ncbi:hypothetical protein MKX01_025532 [Papaver californicum]|nr:hypothetical protein MKX01_025532 [Papaver californicum]